MTILVGQKMTLLTFVFENCNYGVITVSAKGCYTLDQFQQCLSKCRDASKYVFQFFKDSISNDVLETISAEEVELIMSELPDRQKMVFNLFEFEGYKHEEIGEMLEISVRTSKRMLHMARETLKERLIRRYNLKDVI